jgi:hypothetical protein
MGAARSARRITTWRRARAETPPRRRLLRSRARVKGINGGLVYWSRTTARAKWDLIYGAAQRLHCARAGDQCKVSLTHPWWACGQWYYRLPVASRVSSELFFLFASVSVSMGICLVGEKSEVKGSHMLQLPVKFSFRFMCSVLFAEILAKFLAFRFAS